MSIDSKIFKNVWLLDLCCKKLCDKQNMVLGLCNFAQRKNGFKD